MINKFLKNQITKHHTKAELKELKRFLEMDVENEKKEVNKFVIKHVHKLTEEEFQEKKKHRLEYFAEVNVLIDKRLKEIE